MKIFPILIMFLMTTCLSVAQDVIIHEIAQDSKVYAGDTYCVQIIEERAMRLLPKLTEDPDCK